MNTCVPFRTDGGTVGGETVPELSARGPPWILTSGESDWSGAAIAYLNTVPGPLKITHGLRPSSEASRMWPVLVCAGNFQSCQGGFRDAGRPCLWTQPEITGVNQNWLLVTSGQPSKALQPWARHPWILKSMGAEPVEKEGPLYI